LNSAIGYGIYAFGVFLGFPLWLAVLNGQVLGTAFNYFSYGKLVFGAETSPSQVLRFLLSYALTYGLGVGVLYLLTSVGVNSYHAGLINLVLQALVAYFANKYFVYRKTSYKEF